MSSFARRFRFSMRLTEEALGERCRLALTWPDAAVLAPTR